MVTPPLLMRVRRKDGWEGDGFPSPLSMSGWIYYAIVSGNRNMGEGTKDRRKMGWWHSINFSLSGDWPDIIHLI